MTDPCKMAAIVEAAQQWYEARQALLYAKNRVDLVATYIMWTEAEERLIELVSKGR